MVSITEKAQIDGGNGVSTIAPSFCIGSFSHLQVTRTGVKYDVFDFWPDRTILFEVTRL